MRRWNAFNEICGHLRHGLLGSSPGPAQESESKLLIDVSSRHLVTPALAWSTRGMRMPAELRDYLDAVLTLNERRNQTLRAKLEQLVAALNAIDIEPLLLKGAAYLADNLYPALGIRLIGDLDLLIPPGREADALAAAESIGYKKGGREFEDMAAHHLPSLTQARSGVSLELHTALTEPQYNAIVPPDWISQESRLAPMAGLSARVPSPSCAVTHIIVHDQLHHRGFRSGEFDLRQLLDLALMRARYERDIDWVDIERRFVSAGYGDALAIYLAYLELQFGQTLPQFGHAHCPAATARARMRKAVERRTAFRIAVGNLVRLPLGYLAARFRDPRGLRNLGKTSTWRRGLRRIQHAVMSAKSWS
jgi:Uncharacterised nucleotidyltransferase